MGCAQGSPKHPTKILSDVPNFSTSKTLAQNPQNSTDYGSSKKIKDQDLNVSDYQAFLQKSKQQGRTDYPAAFKLIKITPYTDSQISKLKKDQISALNCTRMQLINLSCSIVMENQFAKSKLNSEHVRLLITEIAENYNSVSYHNFTHGFSLMQMLYKCFKMDEFLRKTYPDEDLTYYLIAGITHDVNHPGTNNIYEVKMKSESAKVAENEAVLQKMHLQTFLSICKLKPEFDIISKSSNPQKTKEKITRAILATDMAKHFKKAENLKKKRQEKSFNFAQQQSKTQLMQSLFHGCDISNGLLSKEEFWSWGGILTYQFNEQTKLEAKNNVPVTEFLKFKGMAAYYDDQVNFLNTFVLPLWKQLSMIVPKTNKLIQNCQNNIKALKQLKQKQSK